MNPLFLLLIIPLLTIIGVAAVNDVTKVRWVSAIGMSAQLILSFVLLYLFYQQRNAGNTNAPSGMLRCEA